MFPHIPPPREEPPGNELVAGYAGAAGHELLPGAHALDGFVGRGGRVPLAPQVYAALRSWGAEPGDLGHYAFTLGMPVARVVETSKHLPAVDRKPFVDGYLGRRNMKERDTLVMATRKAVLTTESLGSGREAQTIRSSIETILGCGDALDLGEVFIHDLTVASLSLGVPISWLFAQLVSRGMDETAALYVIHRLRPTWFGLSSSTDVANARRFVLFYGNDVIHVPSIGWHVWDGRRWRRDDIGQVEHRTKGLAEVLRQDGEVIRRTLVFAEDREEEAAILFDARQCHRVAGTYEARRTLTNMLAMAETEPEIAVPTTALDADPWLLNVTNGTIDLRSGELRPHRREDYITKLAPVNYRPGAKFAPWDVFLDQVTGADPEFRGYLQRSMGYCATGLTGEEVMFFAFGPGGSGKSTFVKAVGSTLGDYADTADFESFVKKPGSGGIRNDIARLYGRRFVSSIEVDEGKELAQGLVKTLTGGDVVIARFLYKEFFDFEPTFKLVMVANDPPGVDADDSAWWRRIRVLPLDRVVPEGKRRPWIKALLSSPELAGPAILDWIIQGALLWQEGGLGTAPAIESATGGYRASMDVVGTFIEEICVVGPDVWCPAATLYQAYSHWALANGELPVLTNNLFGRRLTKKGFEPAKTGGQRVRLGLDISKWAKAVLDDGAGPPVLPQGRVS